MHFQRTEALWMLHLYNRKYSSKSNFFMTNPLHSIACDVVEGEKFLRLAQ